jgi:hypothetical protein
MSGPSGAEGAAHLERSLMTTTPGQPLSDDDIETVPGPSNTAMPKDGDADGTDVADADGTDGDSTDSTDGDSGDSDSTDASDGDSTDVTDGDSTDGADADGTDA